MKVKMSKKIVKLVIAIMIIISVSIIGIIASKLIINESLINQTEKTLSEINAKELEKNLIEELKNSTLNVNTSSLKTIFGTEDTFSKEFNGVSALDFALSLRYKNENPYKDYVCAYIVTDKAENGIVVPCFKIISDNNGNFKYILYLTNSKFNVSNVVNKVFKNKYNVNTMLTGNNKYYDKFVVSGNQKYQEKMEIYLGLADDENALNIAREIYPKLKNGNDNQAINWLSDNKDATLAFFGIDK